jgi:thiol:disulfide interchange protein
LRISNTRLALACAAVLATGTGITVQSTGARGDGAATGHGPIAWTSSLPNAQKSAAKTKKIVMVDFSAIWCGPCQMMLKGTYTDNRVITRAKKFVPVLVDIDKQPDLAKKYSIDAIPVALFLDSHGKVLARSLGYLDAAGFLKLMDKAEHKSK